MNPDPLESNVARLVRESALPISDATRDRARTHFLRATDGKPSEAMGRRIAIAAAAFLVAGLLFWSARADRKAVPRCEISKERLASAPGGDLVGSGGNDLLKGTLTRAGGAVPTFLFRATSTLPDGVLFKIRPSSFEETWDAGRIVPVSREGRSDVVPLKDGRFEFLWESSGPRLLRLAVGAPDEEQDVEVLRTLSVKETDRSWTFEYLGWDESLLPLLGPQLVEVGDLARELRDLLARVEAACSSEAQLLALKDALIRDAQKLQSRTDNFAAKSVYPAALHQLAYTARDVATSIPDFKWVEGKFQGPVTYYTGNKKKQTFRQEAFEFAALRQYLDEAEVLAGREFALWILKDRRRSGLQEAHRALVKEMSKRPGVAGFVGRLLVDDPDQRLEEDLRTLAK